MRSCLLGVFRGRFAMVNKKSLKKVMSEEGALRYPHEACGLIVSKGKRSIAIPCRNIATQPGSNFMIAPDEYIAATKRGEVIGVWHTHIEIPPQPSKADLAGCENTELPWFIMSVRKGAEGFEFDGPICIEPTGFEIPYTERPYVSGVLDCYSLLLDFYKREYGIRLRDYPRIETDGRMGYTFFVERYEQEGFVKLIDSEAKVGDVFLIKLNSTGESPNHIAIYIGDDKILHHYHGRLSRRDIYGGGYWQKHTTHHLRHKTLC